jgi:hypothetical protein
MQIPWPRISRAAGAEEAASRIVEPRLWAALVARRRPAAGDQQARTVIRFMVSVPVLSVQIVVALPIVSHASSFFTRLFSLVIEKLEKANDRVTASGKPSMGAKMENLKT